MWLLEGCTAGRGKGCVPEEQQRIGNKDKEWKLGESVWTFLREPGEKWEGKRGVDQKDSGLIVTC